MVISTSTAEASAPAASSDSPTPPDGTLNWRKLIQISSDQTRHIRGSNYVQLATVAETTTPKCRTIVFRGFVNLPKEHFLSNTCGDMSCLFQMTSDQRSQKVTQAITTRSDKNHNNHNNNAELVWWFSPTMEQYRVGGRLLFVGAGDFEHDADAHLQKARQEMWNNITNASRESFLDSRVPGEPYEVAPAGEQESFKGGRDEHGNIIQPPPNNFLLMLLWPNSVDYLRLAKMYRQVDLRAPDGSWSFHRVNP